MNRFIIVDGLPFLFADGKAYAVRWDESGFTVGAEVELASVPEVTYSEISIMAKCALNLDSLSAIEEEQLDEEEITDGEQPTTSFEEMTNDELKDYAKSHDITLGNARTKADMIEKITMEK